MNIFFCLLSSWLCVAQLQTISASSMSREHGELKLFRAPASYAAETAVLLNDAEGEDREVGYQIRATLTLEAVWSESTQFLLKFDLVSPKLYLRGKDPHAEFVPHKSLWDSYEYSTFYAHWKSGLIEAAYLDSNDPIDVLNYKKSLISLFQFQILDGEHNETDISGSCRVLYETISVQVFRKIKRRCEWEAAEASAPKGVMQWRHVARYELAAALDAVEMVHSEEVHGAHSAGAGVKARAWQRLRLAARPARSAAPRAATLSDALAALPAALAPHALALRLPASPHQDAPHHDDVQDLEEALEAYRGALEGDDAGRGGDAAIAVAALRLLPTLRAAAPGRLLRLLHDERNHAVLAGLMRVLGLAGTGSAAVAARTFLQPTADDALESLAHHYYTHLALAPAPHEEAALDAAQVGRQVRGALAESALLAAAAAARHHDSLAQDLRDELSRALANCKDEECSRVRVSALGNLRRVDTAPLLLEQAERGTRGAALAALEALNGAPAAALGGARLQRVADVALARMAPRPLEVRAAALDLVLRRSARAPGALPPLAAALAEHGPPELRRVFWQRLRQLAEEHEPTRHLLAALHPDLKTWEAQAQHGTSTVLVRETGWASGEWGARLDSVQVAAGGLLRAGAVRLLARDAANATWPALHVALTARGLAALADAAPATEDEGDATDAPPSAALDLAVAGTRMRTITLFEGRGELLGHVWAGTGSEPTAVLRALHMLPAAAARRPLGVGVVLALSWRATAAYALDASAQVSLWSRTARARLALRAGAAAEARASLRPVWGEVDARALATAEPRLTIAADLDFYDRVALCVRTHLDETPYDRNVTLVSLQGERRLRVERRRARRVAAPGRSLSLGRTNDAACRALAAADS